MSPTIGTASDRPVAIIPARGGSKGLPRKNLLLLEGKPLIAHTIEVACATPAISRVIVSTDEAEIADVARQFGAEVPFLRPPELARDETPMLQVLQHLLSRLAVNEACEPETIVLLQPTSPLRQPKHIVQALTLHRETGADSVVSLCAAEHHPYWMKRLEGDRVRSFLESLPAATRRQDLPPAYRPNGAVYVSRRQVLMEQNCILGEDTRGLIMDAESSVDIDTLLDFQLAALILRQRRHASS